MKRTLTWIIVALVVIAAIVFVLHRSGTAPSAAPVATTFNLPEFGVALDVPKDLTMLHAVAHDESAKGPGTVLHVYGTTSCDLGALYEIQKNAIAKSGTTWTAASLKQFELQQGNKPPQVKEFTDFYLVFEPNPDTCATDQQTKDLETKQRTELWGALSSAHYMQS